MRRLQLIAIVALVAVPCSSDAQASRAPAGCTYETCALRVEPRFWGPPRLLRGRDGVEIGKLGAFGGGVDTLLVGPDSAASYARRYVKSARTANTLALIGAAASVALLVHNNSFNEWDNTDTALGVTGLAFGIASLPFAHHAQRSLSRAVWFYNAALAR